MDDNTVRETPLAVSRSSRGRWSRLLGGIVAFWPETVVLVIALLLWVPRLLGPIDLRWDGSVYYLLGTSLAQGYGYRILSEPGLPKRCSIRRFCLQLLLYTSVCWARGSRRGRAMAAHYLRRHLWLYAVAVLGAWERGICRRFSRQRPQCFACSILSLFSYPTCYLGNSRSR